MKNLFFLFLISAGCCLSQVFPTRAATDADLYVASDQAQSTLASALNSTSLTVSVISGTQFAAYNIVTVDSEKIEVCSVAGNIMTACTNGRGFGGTVAVSHSVGAGVYNYVSSIYHSALSSEIKAIESWLISTTPSYLTKGTVFSGDISVPNITGLVDQVRFSTNTFPLANEFQGLATPSSQALVGAMNTTTAGTPSMPVVGIGTAGYSWSNANSENAVGVYGAGQLNTETVSPNSSQAWGANFLASNYASNGADGGGHDGNIYGLEVDVNLLRTPGLAKPISNVNGIWLAGASSTNQQVGFSRALHVGPLGIGANVPWDAALYTDDDAAQIGISLGTTTTANGVGSQQLQFRSRTSSGTNQTETIVTDQTGNISIIPAPSASISMQDGLGNGLLTTAQGQVTMNAIVKFAGANTTSTGTASLGANCPAANCTVPYTWIKVTTADGSTAWMPVWK